jgi:hypothetical protein
LGFVTGLHRITRRINRVEQSLLLIEIGAVVRIPERDYPSRVAAARADLKPHCEHWLISLGGSVDLLGVNESTEYKQYCRGNEG